MGTPQLKTLCDSLTESMEKDQGCADLRTEIVANQPVSPGWMVSVSCQALRTLAGGL